jgi:hypothetical protein
MSKIPPTRQTAKPLHRACISCYKEHTETVMMARGEAEFHMAVLNVYAGLDEEDARNTMVYFAKESLGCTPGMVPTDVFTAGHCLCEECAAKTGAIVSVMIDHDGEMPGYVQPEHMMLGHLTAKEKRDFFRDINAYLRTVDHE